MLPHVTANKTYTIGGVKACLMVLFFEEVDYTYSDATLTRINGIIGPAAEDWRVLIPYAGAEWSEDLRPAKTGYQYPQNLSIGFNSQDALTVAQLDQLCRQRVLTIVLDLNNRWWLLGKERGLKGSRKVSSQGYEVGLTGLEYTSAQEVDPDFVSTVVGGVIVAPGGNSGKPVTIYDYDGVTVLAVVQPGGSYVVDGNFILTEDGDPLMVEE